MKLPIITGVKSLISRPDGRILVIRESVSYRGEAEAGHYDVAGGRLEHTETFTEGLRREIWEETSLVIEVGRIIHVTQSFLEFEGELTNFVRLYFQGTTVDDVVKLGPDHDYFEWIEPANYMDFNLYEDLKEVFEIYLGKH